MNKRLTLKSLLSATALAVAALAGTPAWAQTKLKFAHVYETSEAVPHAPRCGPPTRSRSAPTAATRSRSSRPRSWARKPTSTRA